MPRMNAVTRPAPLHAFIIAAAFLLLTGVAVALGMASRYVPWLYLCLSGITFAVYAIDKAAARRSGARVPENTLHLLALAGGWPGALFARQALRHKTRKQPFRSIFWLTVALNVGAFACLAYGQGAWLAAAPDNLLPWKNAPAAELPVQP